MKFKHVFFSAALFAAFFSPLIQSQAQNNTFPVTGNVGIGTTSPLVKLDVELDNTSISDGIRINQEGTGDAVLRLATVNTTRFAIGVDQSDANKLKIGSGISVSANSLVTLTNTGNMGIGTEAPDTKLHLNGADNNGTTATLKITSGTQSMLLDGNEIDAVSTDKVLYLNGNSGGDVILSGAGGKVGIGTTTPIRLLTVKGPGAGGTIMMVPTVTDGETSVGYASEPDGSGDNWVAGVGGWGNIGDFVIGSSDATTSFPKILLQHDGNVGIGTTDPQNKLDVCGTIRANEVKVEIGWCDYVFDKDYELTSLEEVKAHIAENGHLHKTPSAAQVEAEGVKLAATTIQQQEKIEEIFLHMIEMNERLKSLEAENTALKAQLEGDK